MPKSCTHSPQKNRKLATNTKLQPCRGGCDEPGAHTHLLCLHHLLLLLLLLEVGSLLLLLLLQELLLQEKLLLMLRGGLGLCRGDLGLCLGHRCRLGLGLGWRLLGGCFRLGGAGRERGLGTAQGSRACNWEKNPNPMSGHCPEAHRVQGPHRHVTHPVAEWLPGLWLSSWGSGLAGWAEFQGWAGSVLL